MKRSRSRTRSNRLFCRVLFAAFALRSAAAIVGAVYSVDESTFDGGGGLVNSVHYSSRTSLGIGPFGEGAESGSGAIADAGFIPSLNEAPVNGMDIVSRTPGQVVRIPISTLLANDFDFEGDALQFVAVEPLSAGGVALSVEPGTVVFNSSSPDFGADSFHYTITDTVGNISQGMVVILTGGSMLNARVSNGRAEFGFTGIPGRTYQVQVSDSIAPAAWHGLGLVTANRDGIVTFSDPTAGSRPYRFYRAVQP